MEANLILARKHVKRAADLLGFGATAAWNCDAPVEMIGNMGAKTQKSIESIVKVTTDDENLMDHSKRYFAKHTSGRLVFRYDSAGSRGFALTYPDPDFNRALYIDLACGTYGVVGKHILQTIVQYARENDYTILSLDATVDSIQKWKKRGFVCPFSSARLRNYKNGFLKDKKVATGDDNKYFFTVNDRKQIKAMGDHALLRHMNEGHEVLFEHLLRGDKVMMRVSLNEGDKEFNYHGVRLCLPLLKLPSN